MNSKEKINRSIQFKNGSYSSVLTLIVIAIVVVINLAVRSLPATVTTFNTSGVDYYSIGDSTENMLKSLDKDVNVYLLSDSKGSYNEYIDTICSIFSDASERVEYKHVDVVIEPDFAAKYNAREAAAYSVVVENPVTGKYRLIDFNEIYYYNTLYDESGEPYNAYYYDGEGQLASAINYVTSDKTVSLYEIGGHGEPSFLTNYVNVKDAFEKNNYTLSESPLSLKDTQAVPEDCDVLFMLTPSSDYSKAEADAVKSYISNGGNVIVIYNNIYNAELTNFKDILSYAGISVTDGLMIEEDKNYYYAAMGSYAPYALIPKRNVESSLLSGIEDSYLLAFYASSVTQTETSSCVPQFTELLTSSSNHKIVYFEDQYTVDYTEPASIASYVKADFNDTGKSANLLVVGCAMFLEDAANDTALVNNNIKLITNSIKEMSGAENGIYVEPKGLDERFNITTQSQVNLFSIVYLGLIPLAFILAGITVTVIRRAR